MACIPTMWEALSSSLLLWSGPGLAVEIIQGVHQLMEDLPLLLSFFKINNKCEYLLPFVSVSVHLLHTVSASLPAPVLGEAPLAVLPSFSALLRAAFSDAFLLLEQ